MIKYYDNIKYNTETAILVASWDNGRSNSDFHLERQRIYTTKKGRWFVYAYGGAMSRWAITRGNETSGSGDLWPVTPAEALKWMIEHDAEDAILEHFSESFEDA